MISDHIIEFSTLLKISEDISKDKIIDLVPALKYVDSETLFSDIQPGDIIIATTLQNYEELKEVAPDHRLRPMIVARKDDEYVYAFSGSSKNRNYKIMFKLDGEKYNILGKDGFKTGYVDLTKTQKIPKENIKNIQGTLTHLDQFILNDIIWAKTHNNNMQYIQMNYKPQVGQVVRKDNRIYYLAKINDNTGVVYEMFRSGNGYNSIQIPIGKKVYSTSLKKYEYQLDELIPTAVIDKGVLPKIKAREKQSRKNKDQARRMKEMTLRPNHSYRYEAGRVFVLNSIPYIYLFSNGDHDYGVRKYCKEEKHNFLNLEKLYRLDESTEQQDLLSDEELYNTVQELTYYHKHYKWLVNDLFVFK